MDCYHISFEDALDHCNVVETFDTWEEAKVAFQECIDKGPEGYEIGVELIADSDEEWETLEYHEWFTKDSWLEAHPSGMPD
tara:strand:+ start:418 stop:660 length:243 start_codon:yes stop_codon:yes gene_type:complete